MSEPTHPDSQQNINVTGESLEKFQIGGIAGRDLNNNQVQNVNIFNLFPIDSVIKIVGLNGSLSKADDQDQNEYRYHQQLLIGAKDVCRALLQKSLYEKVLIEFELVDKRDTIQKLLSYNDESHTESKQTLSKYLEKNDIFDQIETGRTVLILGEPGAGKTITLMKLAQSLFEKMGDVFSYPIPVVLNLSSWAEKQLPISAWLVEELYDFYNIDKKVGKRWVEKQKLFLFLDGLDEVDKKYRNTCVKALKQFLDAHKLTRIVVCCRAQDYQDLPEKIGLHSIIFIQLLTLPQIKSYLDQVGNQLEVLKILILEEKSELQELARTPLNLSVMSLAFQNYPLKDLLELRIEEAWKNRLWDFYLKKMFERKRAIKHCEAKRPYTEKQTRNYLIWIAKQRTENSQGIFLIERLQPSMLAQAWHPNRSKSSIWKAQLCYCIQSALIFGSFMGFVGVLSAMPFGNLQAVIVFGLFFGGIGTFIGALITGNLDDIKTVETIEWSIKKPPSIKNILRGVGIGILFGIFNGLVLSLASKFEVTWILATLTMSLVGVLFEPMISFIVWMISSLRGPVLKNTTKPNQGIFRSAINAVIVGSIFGLIGFLISGLFGFFNGGLENVLSYGIIGAITYGLLGSLTCGGSACLRYFNLRLTLCYLGYVPWNYTHFLNYATERILMQRVGGGYKFVHGTLREHLAKMELSQKLC